MKAVIISLIIATLSGMGVGGGGLLVIYLTIFEGTDQIVAQGINLCFFVACAIASTVYNVKKKKIVFKTTLILSASGIIFSILGSLVAGVIDANILRKLFGIMLISGGTSSLFSAFSKKEQNKNI